MLPIDVTWVDVTKHLETGQQPVITLERPRPHNQPNPWPGTTEVARVGEFWVPDGSVLVAEGQSIRWAKTLTGDFVRVPVTAYQTAEPAIAALFGLAIQLGIQAAASLAQHRQRVLGVTLVLGHDIHTMPDNTYRGYVGFSFRVN